MFEQPPDFVLLVDFFGYTILQGEGLFKVLFCRDFTAFFVSHLKSEVSKDPHKEGEITLGIVHTRVGFYLYLLSQVNNQGNIIQCLLVNLPNAIIQV